MRPHESTALWKKFKGLADEHQISMVKDLVEKHAIPLLDLIRDTFPTYTLHDETHSTNVLKRMGELLGKGGLENLRPLEATLLILSAFYHDIGMTFTPKERDNLKGEEGFDEFLKVHPDAHVRLHEAGGPISDDIAEEFCRWRHPERVGRWLETAPDVPRWGNVTLNDAIISICRSHGLDIEELLDPDVYDRKFLQQADLAFCSILLRLADILDFDHSRTPEPVFKYLGLERSRTGGKKISLDEWRKHLKSDGFTTFPENRDQRYEIAFVAAPDDPNVDHDMRRFLDDIEREFDQCARILHRCDDRWRKHPLPSKIDRKDIRPQGYKYGDHRFTLQERQILDLFMGENIYDDPNVFVRELLQNAIDAARHRQFFEENRGNNKYEPRIDVSTWLDKEGYRWVRVDDNGMGMDEDIINNYLLKVGACYYKSDKFKADKLSYAKRKGADFTPISRFGIGLLSCFLAGDRIEISTRRAPHGEGLRLSIPGLEGFYALNSKAENHKPKLMPCEKGEEYQYRGEPGTSVAVRLDPRKGDANFNPKEMLEWWVRTPPVPVVFEGKEIGGDPEKILNKPWLSGPRSFRFNMDQSDCVEKFLRIKFKRWPGCQVSFVPLDLTKHSPDGRLKGQLVAARFTLQPFVPLKKRKTGTRFSLDIDEGKVFVEVEEIRGRRSPDRATKIPTTWAKQLREQVLDRISLERLVRDRVVFMSHNGIVISSNQTDWIRSDSQAYFSERFEDQGKIEYQTGLFYGFVALADGLMPDVSLSRSALRQLTYPIMSALALAIYTATENRRDLRDLWRKLEVLRRSPRMYHLLEEALEDPFTRVGGQWSQLPIIETSAGLKSLSVLRRTSAGKRWSVSAVNELFNPGKSSKFSDVCQAVLVQMGLRIHVETGSNGIGWPRCVVDGPLKDSIEPGKMLFPPLFFAPHESDELFRYGDFPLNELHAFSKWLISAAPSFQRYSPKVLGQIRGWLVYFGHLVLQRSLTSDDLRPMNRILDRIRVLGGESAPPPGLKLTVRDFRAPVGIQSRRRQPQKKT